MIILTEVDERSSDVSVASGHVNRFFDSTFTFSHLADAFTFTFSHLADAFTFTFSHLADAFTFTFSHLADAFIQSDLQKEDNRSNQNQQKSNDTTSLSAVHVARFCFCFFCFMKENK